MDAHDLVACLSGKPYEALYDDERREDHRRVSQRVVLRFRGKGQNHSYQSENACHVASGHVAGEVVEG